MNPMYRNDSSFHPPARVASRERGGPFNGGYPLVPAPLRTSSPDNRAHRMPSPNPYPGPRSSSQHPPCNRGYGPRPPPGQVGRPSHQQHLSRPSLPPLDSIGQQRPRTSSVLKPLDAIGQNRARGRTESRPADIHTRPTFNSGYPSPLPSRTPTPQMCQEQFQDESAIAAKEWNIQPLQPRPLQPKKGSMGSSSPRTPPLTQPSTDGSPTNIFFNLSDLGEIAAGPYARGPPSPSSMKDLPPTPPHEDDDESPITPPMNMPLQLNNQAAQTGSQPLRTGMPLTPKLTIPPSKSGPVFQVVQELEGDAAPGKSRRNSTNEYMSLEQLEDMWHSQDMFHLSSVNAPCVPGTPSYEIALRKMQQSLPVV